MHDWILRYGENQQHETRGGFEFATEELARKNGEKFVEATNGSRIFGIEHYPNPKIEIIEV